MTDFINKLNSVKLKLASPILLILFLGTFLVIVLDQINYKADANVLNTLATGLVTIVGMLLGHTNNDPPIDNQNNYPTDINLNINDRQSN